MLDYFSSADASQFATIQIPKELIIGKDFSSLSPASKVLYAVFLAKMGDARKNRWYDDKNRVYIIYPLSDLEEDISYSRHTIISCMDELEDIGLIHKHQIKGKPSRIYVKNFSRQQKFQLIG